MSVKLTLEMRSQSQMQGMTEIEQTQQMTMGTIMSALQDLHRDLALAVVGQVDLLRTAQWLGLRRWVNAWTH